MHLGVKETQKKHVEWFAILGQCWRNNAFHFWVPKQEEMKVLFFFGTIVFFENHLLKKKFSVKASKFQEPNYLIFCKDCKTDKAQTLIFKEEQRVNCTKNVSLQSLTSLQKGKKASDICVYEQLLS